MAYLQEFQIRMDFFEEEMESQFGSQNQIIVRLPSASTYAHLEEYIQARYQADKNQGIAQNSNRDSGTEAKNRFASGFASINPENAGQQKYSSPLSQQPSSLNGLTQIQISPNSAVLSPEASTPSKKKRNKNRRRNGRSNRGRNARSNATNQEENEPVHITQEKRENHDRLYSARSIGDGNEKINQNTSFNEAQHEACEFPDYSVTTAPEVVSGEIFSMQEAINLTEKTADVATGLDGLVAGDTSLPIHTRAQGSREYLSDFWDGQRSLVMSETNLSLGLASQQSLEEGAGNAIPELKNTIEAPEIEDNVGLSAFQDSSSSSSSFGNWTAERSNTTLVEEKSPRTTHGHRPFPSRLNPESVTFQPGRWEHDSDSDNLPPAFFASPFPSPLSRSPRRRYRISRARNSANMPIQAQMPVVSTPAFASVSAAAFAAPAIGKIDQSQASHPMAQEAIIRQYGCRAGWACHYCGKECFCGGEDGAYA